MSRSCRWLGVLICLGCSNLTAGNDGIVALELRLPSPPAVEQNDTLVLHARALNAAGDSVAATVYWRTQDDTLLTVVDSIGIVTTSLTAGAPRVQAYVGSLRSEIVILTIRPRSDTLALTVGSTITVPAADSLSDSLAASVLSNNPVGGVSGTSILYQVVDSVAAQGKLRFANGLLTLRATTGGTGAPVPAVTLRKIGGVTPPASVQVRVSATRPSGRSVPGSGQTFTINFQ